MTLYLSDFTRSTTVDDSIAPDPARGFESNKIGDGIYELAQDTYELKQLIFGGNSTPQLVFQSTTDW